MNRFARPTTIRGALIVSLVSFALTRLLDKRP